MLSMAFENQVYDMIVYNACDVYDNHFRIPTAPPPTQDQRVLPGPEVQGLGLEVPMPAQLMTSLSAHSLG